MYLAKYRCKLCKAEYDGELCNEREASMRMEVHWSPEHYCSDGSRGVPEFLGMRYIDDNRGKGE